MVTLASTLVASVITVALGIVVGTWIGRNKRADRVIRPILDAGQVLPAFVYLVPFFRAFWRHSIHCNYGRGGLCRTCLN
ncbi:MAG: hypothetical protein WDO06_06835 [Actinomycetota bacterium]